MKEGTAIEVTDSSQMRRGSDSEFCNLVRMSIPKALRIPRNRSRELFQLTTEGKSMSAMNSQQTQIRPYSKLGSQIRMSSAKEQCSP
jgi:hypothetical protein